MPISTLLLVIVGLAVLAFALGRRRAFAVAGGRRSRLHSLPAHYGWMVALWALLPALLITLIWAFVGERVITQMVVGDLPAETRALEPSRLGLVLNDIRNVATGRITSATPDAMTLEAADNYRSLQSGGQIILSVTVFAVMILGSALACRRIDPRLRARQSVEWIVRSLLIACSLIAILTTIGIVLSVLFESIRFFNLVPVTNFVFGLEWSPQTAIREDQVGSSGAFGAIPLFAGTLLISAIAMLVAAPTGLLAAIYLSEYASARARAIFKPVLEILAGVPTVVYGFFAALVVAPTIRGFGESIGLDVASESALAAGLVMGIMIIPFVSSLSDDVITAVPQAMRDGSLALGATRSETIRRVVLPAALPGVAGGMLLAVSRAIGETMIVVMAAGLSANLTANPLEAVTTVTVQIVTLLVGDQEFDSAKTLAAFALGLMLFVVTLMLNVIALHIVRKYREQYE